MVTVLLLLLSALPPLSVLLLLLFSHLHSHASMFVRYTHTHMHTCALRYAAAFSIRLLPPHYRNTFLRHSQLVAYERIHSVGLDYLLLVAYGPTCIVIIELNCRLHLNISSIAVDCRRSIFAALFPTFSVGKTVLVYGTTQRHIECDFPKRLTRMHWALRFQWFYSISPASIQAQCRRKYHVFDWKEGVKNVNLFIYLF